MVLSLVFVIFINFFGQLKDWVGQVLFLVSCPKGQVEKYVNVEACSALKKTSKVNTILKVVIFKHCYSSQGEVGDNREKWGDF
jgi:hypothetical protein